MAGFLCRRYLNIQGDFMQPILSPVIAIVAGVLVLIYPKILNYVVAIYLILFGIIEIMHRSS
jgi:uncharacterized membrane protein HdeD (DUF308 family)